MTHQTITHSIWCTHDRPNPVPEDVVDFADAADTGLSTAAVVDVSTFLAERQLVGHPPSSGLPVTSGLLVTFGLHAFFAFAREEVSLASIRAAVVIVFGAAVE